MNFKAGNFSESLKNSFQQFSKQEAEAREHSRQLLLRLDRFEAKAHELGSRTRKALQIKNHCERILMHQHPLIWSHIQRGLVHTMGDMEIPADVSDVYTIRSTREMAVNTSLSSPPSEQHSLHEGVWPHSPSPYPELTTLPLHREDTAKHSESKTFKANEHTPQFEALNVCHENQITEGRNGKERGFYSNEPKLTTNSLLTNHQHNSLFDIQEQQATSRSCSECEAKDYRQQQAHFPERSSTPEHAKDQEMQRSIVPNLMRLDLSASVSKVPFSDDDNSGRDQRPSEMIDAPSKEVKVHKSFHLDSESECADDPISGPSFGQSGDREDSDSFWN